MEKIDINNRTCYYFHDIIEFKDCDFNNIILIKKSSENILLYGVSYETSIGAKSLLLGSIKQMVLLEFMMGLHIQNHLTLKKMMPFSTGLDVLQHKKVELHMLFFTIYNDQNCLIRFFTTTKNTDFEQFIIHIKSVFDNDQNHYYYNECIF